MTDQTVIDLTWDVGDESLTMHRSDGDQANCGCQLRERSSCDPSLYVRFDPTHGDTDKAWMDGYIAVWDSRDCFGTWFNRNDPPVMGLDNLPVGIWYEHGDDPDIQAEIGKITEVWTDDKGIAFRGYLHKHSPHYQRVSDEIGRRELATSAGAVSHLSKFSKDGQFLRWIVGELSLTKNPCERTMPKVKFGNETRSLGLLFNRRHIKGSLCFTNIAATDGAAHRRASMTLETIDHTLSDSIHLEANTMPPQDEAVMDVPGNMPPNPEELLAALVAELGSPQAVIDLLMQQAPETPDGMLNEPDPVTVNPAPAAVTTVPTQRSHVASNDGGRAQGNGTTHLALQLLAEALKSRNAPPVVVSPPAESTPPEGGAHSAITALHEEIQSLRHEIMSSTDTDDEHADQANALSDSIKGMDITDLRYDHLSTRNLITGAYWHGRLQKADQDDKVSPLPRRYFEVLSGRVNDEIASNSPLGRRSYRSIVGKRADEVMYTGQAGHGAEWVKIAYDESLWEVIRRATMYRELLKRGLVEIEIPGGANTYNFSMEGSDPVFYVVPETTDLEADSRMPQAKLTSTKFGTGEKNLTVKKVGAALYFSGEQDEDSLIAMLPAAQRKMDVAYEEQIEYLLINGDTDTSLNTNINLIDGTPTATPEGSMPSFTAFDGFLKLALLGAGGANARDAAAALDDDDYRLTMTMMGLNGKNAITKDKVMFIIDDLTYWATLALAKLQDADTHKAMTFQNGEFEGVWGRKVYPSGQMGLANATGAISSNPANNTLGRILSVRPDQWRLGWKRHTTSEVTRYAKADVTELVTYIRIGMAYRDAEAATVSYGLAV